MVDEHTDGLRRVTGGVHDLQGDLAQTDAFSLGQAAEGKLGLGRVAVADPGTGALGDLEVSGDEIGVQVGVDDPLDREALVAHVVEVLVDVDARVDDHGLAGALVGDQVGGLGAAVEVVLAEDHGSLLV